jgi:hypothetical protein
MLTTLKFKSNTLVSAKEPPSSSAALYLQEKIFEVNDACHLYNTEVFVNCKIFSEFSGESEVK